MLLWWSVPLPFKYGVQHKEVGKFLEMWNFINSNKCFVVSIIYNVIARNLHNFQAENDVRETMRLLYVHCKST